MKGVCFFLQHISCSETIKIILNFQRVVKIFYLFILLTELTGGRFLNKLCILANCRYKFLQEFFSLAPVGYLFSVHINIGKRVVLQGGYTFYLRKSNTNNLFVFNCIESVLCHGKAFLTPTKNSHIRQTKDIIIIYIRNKMFFCTLQFFFRDIWEAVTGIIITTMLKKTCLFF